MSDKEIGIHRNFASVCRCGASGHVISSLTALKTVQPKRMWMNKAFSTHTNFFTNIFYAVSLFSNIKRLRYMRISDVMYPKLIVTWMQCLIHTFVLALQQHNNCPQQQCKTILSHSAVWCQKFNKPQTCWTIVVSKPLETLEIFSCPATPYKICGSWQALILAVLLLFSLFLGVARLDRCILYSELRV